MERKTCLSVLDHCSQFYCGKYIELFFHVTLAPNRPTASCNSNRLSIPVYLYVLAEEFYSVLLSIF